MSLKIDGFGARWVFGRALSAMSLNCCSIFESPLLPVEAIDSDFRDKVDDGDGASNRVSSRSLKNCFSSSFVSPGLLGSVVFRFGTRVRRFLDEDNLLSKDSKSLSSCGRLDSVFRVGCRFSVSRSSVPRR